VVVELLSGHHRSPHAVEEDFPVVLLRSSKTRYVMKKNGTSDVTSTLTSPSNKCW